jgi:hypothetical protein
MQGIVPTATAVASICVCRWQGDEADAALAALQEALSVGPVLLGPLDMGFLPYDPNHMHKRGGDHFIVALKRAADRV